jgi:hypothetical protein
MAQSRSGPSSERKALSGRKGFRHENNNRYPRPLEHEILNWQFIQTFLEKPRAISPRLEAMGPRGAFSNPGNSSWIGICRMSRCTQPSFCCGCRTFTRTQETDMPWRQRNWRKEFAAALNPMALQSMNFFSRPRGDRVPTPGKPAMAVFILRSSI